MADYNEKTVEELKDEAKSRDLHGYSNKNKDELVALLEESDQGDGSSESDSAAETRDEDGEPTLGHDSEASDAQNPDVVSELSPEGQEALEEMGDDSVAAEEADLALDASGPLHLEKPSERLMAGAVNEDEAKEQEKLVGELSEDHVGNIRGDGSVPGREARQGSGENGEVLPEDVIDFPPPLQAVEEERRESGTGRKARFNDQNTTQHNAAREAFPDEGETVAKERAFNQRAQLYTDGLSGEADNNLVLSYRVQDIRPVGQEDEAAESSDSSSDDEE